MKATKRVTKHGITLPNANLGMRGKPGQSQWILFTFGPSIHLPLFSWIGFPLALDIHLQSGPSVPSKLFLIQTLLEFIFQTQRKSLHLDCTIYHKVLSPGYLHSSGPKSGEPLLHRSPLRTGKDQDRGRNTTLGNA